MPCHYFIIERFEKCQCNGTEQSKKEHSRTVSVLMTYLMSSRSFFTSTRMFFPLTTSLSKHLCSDVSIAGSDPSTARDETWDIGGRETSHLSAFSNTPLPLL